MFVTQTVNASNEDFREWEFRMAQPRMDLVMRNGTGENDTDQPACWQIGWLHEESSTRLGRTILLKATRLSQLKLDFHSSISYSPDVGQHDFQSVRHCDRTTAIDQSESEREPISAKND
jgi:hypothetical protein